MEKTLHSVQLNGDIGGVYQSGTAWWIQLVVRHLNDDATFRVDIIAMQTDCPEFFQSRIGTPISLAVRPYWHKQSREIRYTLVNPRLFYSDSKLIAYGAPNVATSNSETEIETQSQDCSEEQKCLDFQ